MPLISIFIGVAVFTIFLIMNIATKGQLGMGDVKLSYSLAVGLGIISLSLSFWTFLLAFSMAGIFALGLLSTGKASLNSSVAFGPFMVLATWITLLLYIR
jgi:leader peptidase (prepilin peptidase)/N-methyltransferase